MAIVVGDSTPRWRASSPRSVSCSEHCRRGTVDRFDLPILDDLSYVRREQAETPVLFELIAARYERKSLAITANQPFSGWDQVFPEAAMTLAAVDRLVDHSTIFELNVGSYRWRAAKSAQTPVSGKPMTKKDKQQLVSPAKIIDANQEWK